MTDQLADVIAEAAKDWLLASDDKRKMHDFIAAAVRAHLASDAVVERMRVAMCRLACPDAMRQGHCEHECKVADNWRAEQEEAIRAALAAAGEG